MPGINPADANRIHSFNTAAKPGVGKRKPRGEAPPQDRVDLESQQDKPLKKWSVFVYMNGNNNLSEQADAKLNYQLKKIDKSDDLNIAVHYSALRSKGWHHPNAINSTRYEVTRNGAKKLDQLGPKNMASSETLSDFVKWGMKNYPAEHYMVVFQGHGGSWTGAMPDSVYDDSMPLSEIKQGLEKVRRDSGNELDVIAFDTCLMANTEAVYQLKDQARVYIGSEEVEFGKDDKYAHDVSAPYKEIFNDLSQKLDKGVEVGPEALAEGWVKACEGKWTTPTTSAMKLSKMDALAEEMDSMAKAIMDGGASLDTVRDIARSTKNMYKKGVDRWNWSMEKNIYLKDLHEFAEKMADDPRITDEDVKKHARGVIKKMDDVVFANQAGTDYNVISKSEYGKPLHVKEHYEGERNHGLSVFIPTNRQIMQYLEKEEKYPEKYREVEFAKDTAWGELTARLADYDAEPYYEEKFNGNK